MYFRIPRALQRSHLGRSSVLCWPMATSSDSSSRDAGVGRERAGRLVRACLLSGDSMAIDQNRCEARNIGKTVDVDMGSSMGPRTEICSNNLQAFLFFAATAKPNSLIPST